jgi:predicted membrane channel-forming protein YqfA (hemolysin III family)
MFFLSPFDVPDKIPLTPIKIHGLILVGLLLTILILVQKKLLKSQPATTITKLTFLGLLICFSSEVIFQTLRQTTLKTETLKERIFYFFLGVISITIFGTVISFLTAFQLKTKKTGQLIIMIIGFLVFINLINRFFPTLSV